MYLVFTCKVWGCTSGGLCTLCLHARFEDVPLVVYVPCVYMQGLRMYLWWFMYLVFTCKVWGSTSGGLCTLCLHARFEDVPLVVYVPCVYMQGLRMYLWWFMYLVFTCKVWGCTSGGLCTLCLHACQVRVTVGASGLCRCTCVKYFERQLTPLCVDSVAMGI